MNIVGIRFQGWGERVYHYKNNFDLAVDDKVVVIDPNNMYQVVTVSHLDCTENEGMKYKFIEGKVLLQWHLT